MLKCFLSLHGNIPYCMDRGTQTFGSNYVAIHPIDGLIEKLINILLLYAFKILSPKFYTKCMEGG